MLTAKEFHALSAVATVKVADEDMIMDQITSDPNTTFAYFNLSNTVQELTEEEAETFCQSVDEDLTAFVEMMETVKQKIMEAAKGEDVDPS